MAKHAHMHAFSYRDTICLFVGSNGHLVEPPKNTNKHVFCLKLTRASGNFLSKPGVPQMYLKLTENYSKTPSLVICLFLSQQQHLQSLAPIPISLFSPPASIRSDTNGLLCRKSVPPTKVFIPNVCPQPKHLCPGVVHKCSSRKMFKKCTEHSV